MDDSGSFLSELKRRKVYQTGVAYIAGSLALWGATEIASDAFGWPDTVLRAVILASLVGLPIALGAAWMFEVRMEGESVLPLKTVRRSRALAIGVTAGIVAFLVLGMTLANVVSPGEDPATEGVPAAPLLTSADGTFHLGVLLFEDGTPRRSLQDVAHAFTYDLVEKLRAAGISVVDAAATVRLHPDELQADSIASLLSVDGLLQGSLELDGSAVVVDLRLLDGTTGNVLVSETDTARVDDFLGLRHLVTLRAADLVRQGIGRAVRLAEISTAAPSSEAWLAVAAGDGHLREAEEMRRRGEAEAMSRALRAAEVDYQRAVSLAPDWSGPLTGQAWVQYESSRLAETESERRQTLIQAAELASAAVEVNPFDREAYEVRGTSSYSRTFSADSLVADSLLASAREDLELALSLDSLDATVNSTLSHLYINTGAVEKAVLAARRSYQNDPYLESHVRDGVLWRLQLGSYELGDYDQAKRWCEEGHRLFPQNFRFVQCQVDLLTMPEADPDVDRAWALLDELRPLLTVQPEYYEAQTRILIGGVIGRAGMPDSAQAVFQSAQVGPEVDPEGYLTMFEAAMRAVMGDVEEAIDILERFVERSPAWSPEQQHWWWDNLEGDPRFEALQAQSSN